MVAALGLAMLLNQPLRGRNFFRTTFFFPYVASLVAVAVVWNMLFFPSAGPVNSLLSALGVQNPPRWSASVDWAMITVILASVWKGVGYYMIIYLAALQSIPSILYEAASVDGANAWQKFRYVTLPMLTPATFFISVMLTIASFKVFDLIMVMTGGGPGRATNVLVVHITTRRLKSSASVIRARSPWCCCLWCCRSRSFSFIWKNAGLITSS